MLTFDLVDETIVLARNDANVPIETQPPAALVVAHFAPAPYVTHTQVCTGSTCTFITALLGYASE